MSIVLGVVEGEVFVNDAEIQKSALQVSGQICSDPRGRTALLPERLTRSLRGSNSTVMMVI